MKLGLPHVDALKKGSGKNKIMIWYLDVDDKVKKRDDIEVLHWDEIGITFVDKKFLGRGETIFVNNTRIIQLKAY